MFRIGFGNDIHRLEKGRPLILGGIEIPSEKGAVGHSDADALTHAITDALLGSMALGDIGSHFSDKDERWKGADSFMFLAEALRLVDELGFEIVNIDSTITLEIPKLRPHIDDIRRNLAQLLAIELNAVSVKAKTAETLDAVGNHLAVKAEACVLIARKV